MHIMHFHIYALWTSHLGFSYYKCNMNELSASIVYCLPILQTVILFLRNMLVLNILSFVNIRHIRHIIQYTYKEAYFLVLKYF